MTRRSAAFFGVATLFAAMFLPSVAAAQASAPPRVWFLENHGYYEPLAADPRAAQVSALALAHATEYPFVVNPGGRRIWDISLGKEIPFLGLEPRRCLSTTSDFRKGCWGIGVWAPVSFHMVEDFKDESSPILNTDYRFGGQLKARFALSDTVRVAGRVQVGHESTHVGDEFVIHATAKYGSQFERVNVSYEYYDFGLSYEQQFAETNFFTARAGLITLWRPGKGFYDATLLNGTTPTLTPSVANREPYAGFEWSQDDGGAIHLGNWLAYLSADVRYKTVYGYHRASVSAPDLRKLSLNTVLGFNRPRTYNQKGVPEIFLRFYRGVNPNGQFRSQYPYTEFGIGIRVPM